MAEKEIRDKYFSDALEVTPAHFRKVKTGYFPCSKKIAKKIAILTNGFVTYEEMMLEREFYLKKVIQEKQKKEKDEQTK